MGKSNTNKRDLKSVSHLFLSAMDKKQHTPSLQQKIYPPEERQAEKTFSLKSLADSIAFFMPESGDTTLFNIYFAHLLLALYKRVTIVSLYPPSESWLKLNGILDLPPLSAAKKGHSVKEFYINENIRLFSLDESIFDDIISADGDAQGADRDAISFTADDLILFDFSTKDYNILSSILLIIDKMVVVSSPDVGELREAYGTIKSSSMINRLIEYFLIFDGRTGEAELEFLYSRFSGIVNRFLDTDVTLLGFLEKTDVAARVARLVKQEAAGCASLNFDPVRLEKRTPSSSKEKMVFLRNFSGFRA